MLSLVEGAKLTRIGWEEENSYILLKKGIILHNKPFHEGQQKILRFYPYVASLEDIEADDWIVAKFIRKR